MEIIGHRGARGIVPENTAVGIHQALALNMLDWVEFDVRHTRDNALVVLHDPFTFRIAKGISMVSRQNSHALQQLTTRSGHPIPSFDEIVKLIGKRAKINIEIKTSRSVDKVVDHIESLVAEGYGYDHFLVSSFSPAILRRVQRRNKEIPLSLLMAYWSFAFLAILPEVHLSAVGFYRHFAHRRAIAAAKRRGLFTYAYTVNDIEAAKRLANKGIDAIITDYPDRMQSLRAYRQHHTAHNQQ